MKPRAESCGVQAAEAKEATSTEASAFDMRERGAQELTLAFGRNGRRRSGEPRFSAPQYKEV
jgi:hypothetical protein